MASSLGLGGGRTTLPIFVRDLISCLSAKEGSQVSYVLGIKKNMSKKKKKKKCSPANILEEILLLLLLNPRGISELTSTC